MSPDAGGTPPLRWPTFFPEDCPSADATEASGPAFRAVKTDPPTESDFLSYIEEGKRIRDETRLCQASGLSVQLTLAGARIHQATFPGVYKFIAAVAFAGTHGKIKPTPNRKFPEHCTWWPYESVVRQEMFRVI